MEMVDRQSYGVVFLRVVVSGLLFVHGVARISLGIVDDFGEFLAISGFPLGITLAWAITIFELIGSILLARGLFVIPIALIFSLHLTIGIFLVHIKDGWFVVGAGRNGVEYSVLLVAVFLFLAFGQTAKSGKK